MNYFIKPLLFLVLVFILGCEQKEYVKDFKVEGIAVGDSLLTYFSEDAKIYSYSGEELQVSLELYESYFASVDSLLWEPHGMSTQTLEDDSIAVVSIPSSATRYFKEQEIQSCFLFERFWIVEGKIKTIVQYKRELAKNYDEIEL